jgi:hypothetical protein
MIFSHEAMCLKEYDPETQWHLNVIALKSVAT